MMEYGDIKELLTYPKTIVIISHRNPDGDAIGSSMGLKSFLEKDQHLVKVIYPSDYPKTFDFIPTIDECIIFDDNQDLAKQEIAKADIIFCLDFNSLDRIDKLAPSISDSKAKIMMIDHHLDPEPFADFTLSDDKASSTCELIYEFVEGLGQEKKIDKNIAEILFIGLITDTGSFKYATRSRTYEVASKLKEVGADDYSLQDHIFNSLSHKQVSLLGHCLANRLEILSEYNTGIIYLSKQDYEEFDIQRGDTEGIVNHILMIKGIKMAAFITEQPTIVKLSLRSKGDISVQDLARNHFNGGGHKNASGGAVYGSLDGVIKKFKSVIPDYAK